MNKLKLYLETTIFNYYFDEDRDGHDATVRLFEEIKTGKYEAYTSEYTLIELRDAKEPKRSDMLSLIQKCAIPVFDIEDEAGRLADIYVQNNMIPEPYRFDGAHIASASIHGLDCILSFNFKHINKLKTKRMSELINLNEGYKGIIICTPMEVFD
jgi:predicted nucleic acid-binding protein